MRGAPAGSDALNPAFDVTPGRARDRADHRGGRARSPLWRLHSGGHAGGGPVMDADALLASTRRPLVLGIGGGGDVVGALAVAESCRLQTGARPVVGGVTWERRPIDPAPGPRHAAEIEGARELAPAVLEATAATRVAASGVRFAEARMAELLGEPTVLVDVNRGAATVARGPGAGRGRARLRSARPARRGRRRPRARRRARAGQPAVRRGDDGRRRPASPREGPCR